jgi:hypothetical protein
MLESKTIVYVYVLGLNVAEISETKANLNAISHN